MSHRSDSLHGILFVQIVSGRKKSRGTEKYVEYDSIDRILWKIDCHAHLVIFPKYQEKNFYHFYANGIHEC